MSWDINKVIVVGRLSADVELKYTPSGTAVARFGLAVGGKPKTDGSDSVSFFNVVHPAQNPLYRQAQESRPRRQSPLPMRRHLKIIFTTTPILIPHRWSRLREKVRISAAKNQTFNYKEIIICRKI
ncbi:MAG: single-stranded DNA-binding protein [Brevinematales bacterium]